uniref:Uncharacterized protein n=1 Tax=Arundo donax TaxID=35708 RepID=A0A0A8Y368_ARUDO
MHHEAGSACGARSLGDNDPHGRSSCFCHPTPWKPH